MLRNVSQCNKLKYFHCSLNTCWWDWYSFWSVLCVSKLWRQRVQDVAWFGFCRMPKKLTKVQYNRYSIQRDKHLMLWNISRCNKLECFQSSLNTFYDFFYCFSFHKQTICNQHIIEKIYSKCKMAKLVSLVRTF